MTNTLLHDLATEIREVNAANGWGLDFDPAQRDTIPSYLALIHSEITEAWEANTNADAMRELGDVIIRCLDLGELIQPGYWQECHYQFTHPFDPRQDTWETDLLLLHQKASQALEAYRKEESFTPSLLRSLHLVTANAWRMIERYGMGAKPVEVLRGIISKNRQRGYRHGGRRT
ncbi:hypothetical protein ACFSR9_08815 [Deinococcus taklimakanensis]|uniref:Uncharacterized protein n=1 Tax=Deinococcus taklimakanensis TaxID=536443 RepID=A0ABW5P657_9DEIO